MIFLPFSLLVSDFYCDVFDRRCLISYSISRNVITIFFNRVANKHVVVESVKAYCTNKCTQSLLKR